MARFIILFLLLAPVYSRLCLRNYPDTTWIGDSRSDQSRVNPQSLDLVTEFKGVLQAKNGNGLLKQMSGRFPSDWYTPTTKYRILYLGTNDCTDGPTDMIIPTSMTLDNAARELYLGACRGDVRVTPTFVGAAIVGLVGRTDAITGFSVKVLTFSSPTIVVVGLNGMSGIYKVCIAATSGNVGGVTLINGCGYFNTPLRFDNFKGQIYVSDTFEVRGTKNKCVLLRSSSDTPLCSHIMRNVELDEYVDTPNTGGVYPSDGFDSLHGSASVRTFLTDALTCPDIDWSRIDAVSCEYDSCPKMVKDFDQTSLGNTDTLIMREVALHKEMISKLQRNITDVKIRVDAIPPQLNQTFNTNQVEQPANSVLSNIFISMGVAGFGIALFLAGWKACIWIAAFMYKSRGRIPPSNLSVA
nr:hemagglutinin-esterase [Isavirus salaris]UFY86160.1 hemagglutinin-esterase [Isavirus salaris]UFY86162.1 hemagglutinin-esterase [Isavirus salaris]UFY86218.1 hemagglutinin-esterase [Isavirus salaris]UFY86219.1 hemagglutinin-esterase [Isavirus salaris]